jgi:hypothetical protein
VGVFTRARDLFSLSSSEEKGSSGMTKPLPETLSFRDFARLVPCRPSYVTHLRQTDRLVLTDDGKRVKVRESLQRIEDTRDPARIGVVRRHADDRTGKTSAVAVDAPGAQPAAGEGAIAASPDTDAEPEAATAPAKDSSMFQHWRERGERAKALAAERENAIAEGKLLAAAAVLDAIRSHVASLRAGLEALPDFLAPQLVGVREETKVRALIAEAIESRLAELSRQFGGLVKETA